MGLIVSGEPETPQMQEVATKLKRHCRRPELVAAFKDVSSPCMEFQANSFAGKLSCVDPDAHLVAVACCKLAERQFTDVFESFQRGELPSFIKARRVCVENALDAATSNAFPVEIRDLIVSLAEDV